MPRPIVPIVPSFKLPVTTFAKDQPEYIALPAHVGPPPDFMTVTRWRFSFTERVRILLSGDLWLTILTFGKPLQPVKLDAECPIFGHLMSDEED